ncbi:MAG: hypothetical protein V4441_04255 [Pseudomonadota bacterium]
MTDQPRGPITDMHNEFTQKKLDVLAALTEAYKGAWTHLGEMVRLIWLPVVLSILVSTIAFMLPTENNKLLLLALQAVSFFLSAIISVAWYRFILLNEKPTGSYQIHFGAREGRYLIVFLALLLLVLPLFLTAPQFPPGAALQDYMKTAGPAASLVGFFGLLIVFVGLYFFARLYLLLPAMAIDEPINVRLVLERTRGNFWRIVLLSLLSNLPVIIAYGFIILVSGIVNLPDVIAYILQALVTVFFNIVSIAVFAIAYRELIGPKGAMAADLDRPDTI